MMRCFSSTTPAQAVFHNDPEGAVEAPLPPQGRRERGAQSILLVVTVLFYTLINITSFPVHAASSTDMPSTSLFFTSDETQKIETLNAQTGSVQANGQDIHLGAVIYYGEGNWTLWLQGQRWTPETNHADVQIIEVQPHQVLLKWTQTPHAVPQQITLRPYQTYQTVTGKIVEGGE